MSYWLFPDNIRRVFSFSVGNKGQLENADWTIGLLSRFLTLRLHYSTASVGAFVPVTFSPGIPFSRAGVNLFPLSLPYAFSRFVLAFPLHRLSLASPDHQNASLKCRGGETLDSQIIESNSGGQFLSVAPIALLLRLPLSPPESSPSTSPSTCLSHC